MTGKQDIEIADKRFIKVRNEEDYKRIAKLLDKAGKKWSNGDRYTKWSPYGDEAVDVHADNAITIDPVKGTWTWGKDHWQTRNKDIR